MNWSDDGGVTPLHAAVYAQSSELVTLLLSAGADPNEADNQLKTPLYTACDLQHCEIATKLIDAKANINQDTWSPLLTACEHNCLDIVQLLLDSEADPNLACVQKSIISYTLEPVFTSSGGYYSSEQPVYSINQLQPIFFITHEAGHYDAARLLLEYGANPSVLNDVGLKSVCELGYIEVAQHIVQNFQGGPIPHDLLDQAMEAAFQSGFLRAMFEVFVGSDVHDYFMQLAQALFLSTAFAAKNIPPEQGRNTPNDDGSLLVCLQKKNIARMRELIRTGHDVNISNVAGRSLLQECIQQGITHVIPDLCDSSTHVDIDHRDSAGRTALFESLTSPYTFRMQGKSVSVFEYLVSKGANVNIRDHFGRTVLHEWQPVSDGTRCGPSLQTLIQHIDINSTDYKGQTALHLAVLTRNIVKVRQLVENGSDWEARDVNGLTPVFLSQKDQNMLNVVPCKYHPNGDLIARESIPTKDSSEQCVHMLKDKSKQHRLVPALKEVFRERAKHTQVENFANMYASRVCYTMQASIQEEMLNFENTIVHMLQEINTIVVQEEPVLSFMPRLSGSCAEGTKVIEMDEADMLCVFDHNFWKHVTLSPSLNNSNIHDNPSFVQITCPGTEHRHLFNGGDVLSKRKLLQRLYSLIRKALPTVLKSISSLYMIDVKNSVANDHSLACLSMVWHGQHLPWQEFTVDVVPAIPVTQEQLPDAIRQVMSHSHIIQDLFVVPKTGTFDQSQNDAAFRLSFSSTERDLFLAMPAALKQGYMLTKVLVHDCFTIDNIHPGVCSYNLKTATFECFRADMPEWDNMVTCASKTDKVDQMPASAEAVVKHAQKILERLEKNFAKKHQSSFFFQRCDLMVHSIDKNDYRQMLYVLYCLAVLSDTGDAAWQNLADYVAEQLLLSENLHESSFLQEIEILLELGLKCHKNIILGAMIKVGQVAGVRMLLERGASVGDVGETGVSARNTSALQLAHAYQAHDVCIFLEDTTKGISLLHYSWMNLMPIFIYVIRMYFFFKSAVNVLWQRVL